MVDPNHLDRVKAVYIDENGSTAVSSNLRATEKNSSQSKSIYPVHAALGLTVSRMLFVGCQVVVVEGPSDQHYLNAIKNYLIGKGLIRPSREILFVPAGGVSGIGAVVAIVTGKDESLPFVVLDSDSSGKKFAESLKSKLYVGNEERTLMVGDYCGLADGEIEDFFPHSFLAHVITKYLRGQQEDFSDVVVEGQSIIPQVKRYAEKYGIKLEKGWKVEVAIQAKQRLQKANDQFDDEAVVIEKWKALFSTITS